MPSLIQLVWERDADGYTYELRVPEEGDPDREIEYFVPIGSKTITYHPLEEFPALFMEFAALGRTFTASEEGISAFVEKYGLLELEKFARPSDWVFQSMLMNSAVSVWQESVKSEDMTVLAEVFNQQVDGAGRDYPEIRAPISVKFVKPWDTKHPRLCIVPKNLLSGLWIQFAQAVSANAKFHSCGWCSTWYRYGAGTGRRKTAHYCSARCRKAAFAHRKETGT